MSDTSHLAAQLVEALAHLAKAQSTVNAVLLAMGTKTPPPTTREHAARRTTSLQILCVMADYAEPITLIDIADGVVAIRRGEDEPKKQGGTRYQEMCRTSLSRLIERGIVERVEPETKRGMMRFRRAGASP